MQNDINLIPPIPAIAEIADIADIADIPVCPETIDPETFREMVAERAYGIAEKRGFTPDHDEEDWLAAECEIGNQCSYWSQDVD